MTFETSDLAEKPPLGMPKEGDSGSDSQNCSTDWTYSSGLQPLSGDTSFSSSTGNLPVSSCHRSHQSSSTTTTATTTSTTSSRKRNRNSLSSVLVPRPSPPCSDTALSSAQKYHNLSQLFWSQYSTSLTTSHKSSEVRWHGLSLPAIVTVLFLISSSVLLQCHHVEAHWQENIAPLRRIHLSK